LAFTTVTGSNGVTSLVGTTGIDVATIVTLSDNVFIGANTADDVVTTQLGTGGNNLTNYIVRMGGGDDTFNLGNVLLNSYISTDGETIANDGNDIFNGNGNLIVNSEIVGRGGNDAFNDLALSGSTVNGNTGDDLIRVGNSSSSFVYGGQGIDDIRTTAATSAVLINGNKGSDTIVLGAFAYTSGSVYGGNGTDVIDASLVDVASAGTAGVMLSGDLGDDTVSGTGGIDPINGGDGADVLVGLAGADVIDGGAGDDVIIGGANGDSLNGGSGANLFVYAANGTESTVSGSTGFDTITGFVANTSTTATPNGDRIDIGKTAAAFDNRGNVASTAATLADALNAVFTTVNFAVNEVGIVTFTGAVSYAGSYIVVNDGTAGYINTADNVIKINSVANLSALNIGDF
jgi:Ca2+-binding RTX toxin-like protein